MASNFYLVLPSNASMHLHTSNMLTNYVTMLLRRISLSAECECGLVVINYPHNFFNVREKDAVFTIQPATGRWSEGGHNCYHAFIVGGYYDNPDTLTRTVNKKIILSPTSSKKRTKLSCSDITQKATMHSSPNTRFTLTEDIGQLLGFPSTVISSPTGNYSFKQFEGRSVVDLNQGLESLYVYSSLVEPRIVGNSVPLLRIVPITGKHGQVVSTLFDNVHYLPLLGKEFGTIHIYIRDDTGRSVPFERGKKVTVTLHFRRRKNRLF